MIQRWRSDGGQDEQRVSVCHPRPNSNGASTEEKRSSAGQFVADAVGVGGAARASFVFT